MLIIHYSIYGGRNAITRILNIFLIDKRLMLEIMVKIIG